VGEGGSEVGPRGVGPQGVAWPRDVVWPAEAATGPAAGRPVPPASTSTAVRAGNFQRARQGRPFAAQLTARVVDGEGRPVAGAWVTFRVCSGAAGFAGGARVASAATGATGVATAPVLTAGAAVGGVRVAALVPGTTHPATYALRVIPY
jgi:hypothetical protein